MKIKLKEHCPVCSNDVGKYYLPVGEYRIYKCSNCGLEHTLPIPLDKVLREFYADYGDIRARTDVVKINALSNLKLLDSLGLSKSSTILDFGAGGGEFVDIAGSNCFGVDIKTSKKERIFNEITKLPCRQYDFITLWGVFEHLPNPKLTIRDLVKLLTPEGKIIITTVDAEGVIPYYYKPVEHLTYWTKSALIEVLNQNNLRIIKHEPYKMIQRTEVYLDLLLSRTPLEYRSAFDSVLQNLPEYISVPTNEVFVACELFSNPGK